MINEIVYLQIKEGQSIEFEEAFYKAKKIVARAKGFISLELYKHHEKPERYIMKIVWGSIDDHKLGFRKLKDYQEWKALLHRFYEPMPNVEYFEEIIKQKPI